MIEYTARVSGKAVIIVPKYIDIIRNTEAKKELGILQYSPSGLQSNNTHAHKNNCERKKEMDKIMTSQSMDDQPISDSDEWIYIYP